MRDSLFKLFGSIRLIQEVTRSNRDSPSHHSDSALLEDNTPMPIANSDNDANNVNINNLISNESIKENNVNENQQNTTLEPQEQKQEHHIEPIQNQKEQKNQKLTSQTHTQPLIHPTSSSLLSQQLTRWSVSQPIPITFSTFSTPNVVSPRNVRNFLLNMPSSTTPSSTTTLTTIVKPHTRRNSKYIIRHHRTRQLSFNSSNASFCSSTSIRKHHTTYGSSHGHTANLQLEDQQKSKSHKILCLWPLPIVTRYMILIALLVSTLNSLNILNLSCSSPSFVLYRLDIKNLVFSPFLFDWTLPSIMLYGWNVLILGLFEESLSHIVSGTRRFIELLVVLFTSVSSLRVLLGFLFSKSTGWAFPSLFFSDSMHECSQGLSPFLFALLVVQSLCIDDKYILIYGQEDSNHKVTVRKVTLQLFMCLINYTVRNILWWSLSGLITGFLATIALQTLLAHEKREDSGKVKDVMEFITLERYRRTPLWRLIWSSMKKSVMVVTLTLPVLMALNSYYTQETLVTSSELSTIMSNDDQYLFTLVFMTAPRRGDPAYLTRTIETYLANWPEDPSPDSPYSHMQAIIYTHFSNHSQYDLAQDYFSKTTKGQRYLRWIQEEGKDWNQRLHVSKALDYVTNTYQSTYYALMEDDFPVCGQREWHEIENIIYQAHQTRPNHCGIFVGTGGSGLFLKPDVARLTSKLLLKYADMPPDIIIQKCLRGQLPECSFCTDSLITSKTLLMYHIGYNTSTSADRVYKKDEFQCGWRHPFNGDPSVITI
ncbi:uncharacterized protein BX663DRAFT_548153 [Cokeromyces recurvatus]|uniref:uncharacterized protein n=1 Tax=Cokeromyces recurvatus TaxID=90255 RepID=UPI00221E4E5C|nr:uncharacterized protein BX663DRAFT_548153 [Cokeromyces recurvatus]KAI7907067.1 hypothetical protein BX663DRAFT_548153 [Cokeromyces recurvatus]